MELKIKESLIALLAGIKCGDGAVIARESARLDEFLDAGRDTLHPQLVHFLERRSYAKAEMFLGGANDIPAGICGGRAGKNAAS
jgi:hypothetical protein